MALKPRNIDPEPAIADLRNRTLARLPSDFSRLVYLASSRDLNTGHYFHDGLAFHFSEAAASKAMALCHREIFERLVYASLGELTRELSNYISSTDQRPEEVLESWRHLESYRVTVPSESEPLEVELFLSNVKIAIAILQTRQPASQPEQSA